MTLKPKTYARPNVPATSLHRACSRRVHTVQRLQSVAPIDGEQSNRSFTGWWSIPTTSRSILQSFRYCVGHHGAVHHSFESVQTSIALSSHVRPPVGRAYTLSASSRRRGSTRPSGSRSCARYKPVVTLLMPSTATTRLSCLCGDWSATRYSVIQKRFLGSDRCTRIDRGRTDRRQDGRLQRNTHRARVPPRSLSTGPRT